MIVKGSDGWLFGMGWVEVEVVVRFSGRQALVTNKYLNQLVGNGYCMLKMKYQSQIDI